MVRILCMIALVAFSAVPARAQSLIRDADIEYAMRQLMKPVANAAGLGAGPRVLLVNDSSLNAFVVDSRTVFIHTGLLLKLDSAAQLQAVFAHEIAHISNGHITRRFGNFKTARSNSLAGLAAAIAVGVASGNAQAAGGVLAGTQSAATRNFLAHTRGEESSADQSGARFLARAGIDPQGMVEVLDLFRGQELLSVGRVDPYALTHPLSAERLRAVKGYAVAYGADFKGDPNSEYWFARAKGKLGAFIQNPTFTLRKIKASDTSDIAMMRRAVAYHKRPDAKAAIAEINKLVAKRPNDPYVHELRGQILLETRNFQAAVSAYGKAVNLAPNEPLIRAGYGQALLATNTPSNTKKALNALEAARSRDSANPRMLRDLAVAYARLGNNGMASVATAERYALQGRLRDAGVHAKRASDLLPQGSAGWLRAQDILQAARAISK